MLLLLPEPPQGRPPLFAAPTDDAAPRERKRARILIVEDDYFVAMDVEHRLSQAGFEVTGIASTAQQAFAMATARKPDLAIMDIRLAGAQDGVHAAIELQTKLGVPSIFATAHGNAETRKRAAAAAPRGWLQKPYTAGALIDAINAALGKSN